MYVRKWQLNRSSPQKIASEILPSTKASKELLQQSCLPSPSTDYRPSSTVMSLPVAIPSACPGPHAEPAGSVRQGVGQATGGLQPARRRLPHYQGQDDVYARLL